MPWIEPIIDRTNQDVESLKQLMSYILQFGWETVDQDTRVTWLGQHKGAFNVSDINRIQSNILYVRDMLLEVGIIVHIDESNPTWNVGDYISLSNINILRNNVIMLSDAWHTYNFSPTIDYSIIFDYDDANDIELNLLHMKLILDLWAINIKPSCGTFNCGQDTIL